MPYHDMDRCREAATRAYRELRRRGVTESHALCAAVRVFGHHFPTMPPACAVDLVADWLEENIVLPLN